MIDWQKIVLEIRAKKGVSLSTVARHLNMSAKHIQDLSRGGVAEPKYSKGVMLLEIHKQLTMDND